MLKYAHDLAYCLGEDVPWCYDEDATFGEVSEYISGAVVRADQKRKADEPLVEAEMAAIDARRDW
jgi:hypothetical protein